MRQDIDITGTVLANLRGPNHPYPYFVENDHGTVSATSATIFTSSPADEESRKGAVVAP